MIITKKNILIIGGAGFIGSQVNKMVAEAGYNTIVLDNLSTGSSNAIVSGKFIYGDLSDSALLHQIFAHEKIDAVMHFAAFINVGESVKDPLKYYTNNVGNTVNLFNAMKHYQVKNFIFSSSAAVYGNPIDECASISELHPRLPVNPYGETKLMVEKILHDCSLSDQINFCALRYFNAAGGDPSGIIKNAQQTSSNLIPIILKSLKRGTEITIFGTDYPTKDGTCIRDYIHIYDLGTAHLNALEKLIKDGHSACYNLGNGQGYSVRDVINTTQHITGLKVKVIEGVRRAGDPAILVANAEKAVKELNWTPKYTSLEAMIRDAWKAFI